jgi:hypothetical protein
LSADIREQLLSPRESVPRAFLYQWVMVSAIKDDAIPLAPPSTHLPSAVRPSFNHPSTILRPFIMVKRWSNDGRRMVEVAVENGGKDEGKDGEKTREKRIFFVGSRIIRIFANH